MYYTEWYKFISILSLSGGYQSDGDHTLGIRVCNPSFAWVIFGNGDPSAPLVRFIVAIKNNR